MAAQGACSRELALDAQCVLDHVWPDERVHVAGPSMGGFVAQHLACLLLQRQQLLSLYLMVTSLGFQPRLRFPLFAFNAATSFILRGNHRHASACPRPAVNYPHLQGSSQWFPSFPSRSHRVMPCSAVAVTGAGW